MSHRSQSCELCQAKTGVRICIMLKSGLMICVMLKQTVNCLCCVVLCITKEAQVFTYIWSDCVSFNTTQPDIFGHISIINLPTIRPSLINSLFLTIMQSTTHSCTPSKNIFLIDRLWKAGLLLKN